MKYYSEFILCIYLFLINTINFVLFKTDKKRARNREWRIPESTLLLVSILGGTIGGILGMNVFRHKTKKLTFTIGMPLLLVLNIFMIKYIQQLLFLK